MLLRITHYGESVLKEKAVPVTSFDSALKQLASDMVETMHENKGIGLAAQQVNSKQMVCVVDISGIETDLPDSFTFDERKPPIELIMPLALVNPTLELMTAEKVNFDEGCLSFPGIRGEVTRPDRLRMVFQDVEGGRHTMECNGLLSRVIQHEFDHLNGILFIDRMEPDALRSIEPEIKALKRQTRDLLKSAESPGNTHP